MNKFYETSYIDNSGKTLLQTVLEALPKVDGRSQWDGISSHGKHNIQFDNTGIVEVKADESVYTLLDADVRFPSAGEPYAVDRDGEPDDVKRDAYQAKLKTARSDERQRKHHEQQNLDGVMATIAQNEADIIRLDAQAATKDNDIIDYQNLLIAVGELEAGEFAGDPTLISNALTELFPRQADGWLFIIEWGTDEELVASTYDEIERALNSLITQTAKEADQLEADSAQRTHDISGTKDEGQNLTQRQAELETKLGTFPS